VSVNVRRFVSGEESNALLFACDSLDTVSDPVGSDAGSPSVSTAHVREGVASIKQVSAVNTVAYFDVTLPADVDMTNLDYWEWWVYSVNAVQTIMYVGQSGEAAKFTRNANFSFYLTPGWNRCVARKVPFHGGSPIDASGITDWTKIRYLRLRVAAVADTKTEVYFDSVRWQRTDANSYEVRDGTDSQLLPLDTLTGVTFTGYESGTTPELATKEIVGGGTRTGIRLYSDEATAVTATQALPVPMDMSLENMFSMKVWSAYVAAAGFPTFTLYLSEKADLTKAWYSSAAKGGPSKSGWVTVNFPLSSFTRQTGEEPKSFKYVKIVMTGVAGQKMDAVVADLRYGACNRPKVVLTFDDLSADAYATAYPVLVAKGLAATFYAITGSLGVSLANIRTMVAAGMDIQNHTDGHNNMGAYTYAQALPEITTARDYLRENGISAGDHLAWPNGASNTEVVRAARDAGIKTMRGISTPFIGSYDTIRETGWIEGVVYVNNGDSAATVIGKIDDAIAEQGVAVVVMHTIAAGTFTAANFTALCAWLVAHKAEIDTVTMSELWNSL
jgi:peptidoglycan/xylan/chitin deacetylase (PgdA/CDA1 family)